MLDTMVLDRTSTEERLNEQRYFGKLFVGEKKDETARRYDATCAQRDALTMVAALWRVTAAGEAFWAGLDDLLDKFEPIIQALADLESDKASASRVYERFRWLLEHRVYVINSTRQTRLQRVFTNAIVGLWCFGHTDAMGISFLLDPRTKLNEFMDTDKIITMNQAVEFVQRGCDEFPSLLT